MTEKFLKKTFVNTAGIKKEIIRYGIIKPKINKKKILKKFFKKFPILKNTGFYLFLGRFHKKKGCEVIIESVKKLKNNFKNIILFSGPMSGSKYEAKLISLVQKYNLQKKLYLQMHCTVILNGEQYRHLKPCYYHHMVKILGFL